MGTHRLAAAYITANSLICKTFFLEINIGALQACSSLKKLERETRLTGLAFQLATTGR